MYIYICMCIYIYIIYIYACIEIYIHIYIYKYTVILKEIEYFWRVRDLCWNYVGCWPLKKNSSWNISTPPGRSKTGSWNMALRGR